MTMIIMNAEQADAVRGVYGSHEIAPVLLVGGDYCLPVECAENLNYPQNVRELLNSYARREVSESEFVNNEESFNV